MSDWDKNVHYNPEKSGLVSLYTLDEDDLSYEYHTLSVWRHRASGRVYFAEDSGCSCPTPFEWCFFENTSNHNLEEVSRDNYESFFELVDNFPDSSSSKRELKRIIKDIFENES